MNIACHQICPQSATAVSRLRRGYALAVVLILSLASGASGCSASGVRSQAKSKSPSRTIVSRYCMEWGHVTLTPRHDAMLRTNGKATVLVRGLAGKEVRVALSSIARGVDVVGIPLDAAGTEPAWHTASATEVAHLRLLVRPRVRTPRTLWRAHDAICGATHVPTWMAAIAQLRKRRKEERGASRRAEVAARQADKERRARARAESKRLQPIVARLAKKLAAETTRRRRELEASPRCQEVLGSARSQLATAIPPKYLLMGRVTCHDRGGLCLWGTAMPIGGSVLGPGGMLAHASTIIFMVPRRKDFLTADQVFARGVYFHGTTRVHNSFGGSMLAYLYSRQLPVKVARRRRKLERVVRKTGQSCERLRRKLKRYYTLHEEHANAVEALNAAEAGLE